MITSTITSTRDHIKISKSSPDQKNPPKAQDPATVFPANKRAPPLEGGNSMKIASMWTLKHDISSPKFYELLIKTEIKGDTAMNLNKLYKQIKMCPNAVARLQE